MTPERGTPEQMKTIEANLFRMVCGQFVTGVAVVTSRTQTGAALGITINSFTSASLEPPLVMFCLRVQSGLLKVLRDSRVFAVNILAEHQESVSLGIARSALPMDDLEHRTRSTGAPVLADALAYLDCRVVAEHEVGDHVAIVGHVADLGVLRQDRMPLALFRSRYHAVVGRA